MLTLLDLSNNNGDPLDFAAVRRAGAFGVWLKVSEGRTFTDPTFQSRARAARRAGLRVGGYHFARPVVGLAGAEAGYFVERLGGVGRRDLHPVLDLEVNDNRLSSAQLREWVRTFELHVHKLTGARCLLYSSPGYLTPLAWPRTLGTGAGLWLADYGVNDGRDHGATAPAPWRGFAAHQFTSVATWPGVNGHVDLSHASSRRRVLAHPLLGLL